MRLSVAVYEDMTQVSLIAQNEKDEEIVERIGRSSVSACYLSNFYECRGEGRTSKHPSVALFFYGANEDDEDGDDE